MITKDKKFTAVTSPHKFTPVLLEKEIPDFEHYWATDKNWVLCNLSHLAYFQAKPLTQQIHRLKPEKTVFYENDGAQAFLSIWKDKAILSFRGTQLTEHNESDDDTGRVIIVDHANSSDFHTAWKQKDVQDFHGNELTRYFEVEDDVGNTVIINNPHDHLTILHKLIIKALIKIFPFNPFWLLFQSNDIFADFKFFHSKLDQHKHVKVHSGFLEESDKLWSKIKEHLEKFVGSKPVWVTGHSLGGAMATIAGTRYPFEAVTTFGEPRVGKRIEQAFLSKVHRRFVNGDDPVTKVPPAFFGYYKHHGNLHEVDDNYGNFIYDHSILYYAENILIDEA